MSPLTPTPLLILAGVIGFGLALSRVGRPTGNLRMMAEVFAVDVLTCLGFAAASALYWSIEQRWSRPVQPASVVRVEWAVYRQVAA